MAAFYLWLYQLLFTLALPLVGLRFWWRGQKAPAYRLRWKERLGILPEEKLDGRPKIWFHAVSLGEMVAATPLIKQMLVRFADHQLIVTTTTPTGSERVISQFGEQVVHIYGPLDVPLAVNAFLKKIQPALLVIMETELWPTLITSAADNNVPIVLVNARLSEKSLAGYCWIASLTALMLQKITRVFAQSDQDAERFVQLGLPIDRVENSGNLKFDINPKPEAKTVAATLRAGWGEARPVWIAASTHETEEAIALAAHEKILAVLPDVVLMIVPRHPERFDRVAGLIMEKGYAYSRRSEKQIPTSAMQVFLGDTVGEMDYFYAAADVAFVGGSFISLGGHNLLEPAALSLAITTGPTLHNFAEIARLLEAADAVKILQEPDRLAETVISLLQDKAARQKMGQAALTVVKQNQGALERTLKGLKQQITKTDKQLDSL